MHRRCFLMLYQSSNGSGHPARRRPRIRRAIMRTIRRAGRWLPYPESGEEQIDAPASRGEPGTAPRVLSISVAVIRWRSTAA